jgi:DNA-binding transcriptional LysR family regulator
LAIKSVRDKETERVFSRERSRRLPPDTLGVQSRPFTDDEIVLIVSAGHALARRRSFAPDLLTGETLIVREAGSATQQIAEDNLERLGLTPKRVLEMTGCEAVKRTVAAGLGVAFVSQRAISLEAAQRRVHLPDIPELRFRRQLFVLTRKDARHPAATLAFLALLGKERAY